MFSKAAIFQTWETLWLQFLMPCNNQGHQRASGWLGWTYQQKVYNLHQHVTKAQQNDKTRMNCSYAFQTIYHILEGLSTRCCDVVQMVLL